MITPIHPLVRDGLKFTVEKDESGASIVTAHFTIRYAAKISSGPEWAGMVEQVQDVLQEKISAGMFGYDNAIAKREIGDGKRFCIPERGGRQGTQDCNVGRLVQILADNSIWIAPVGTERLHGFMVCKRSINNVDGNGNTRIDYLVVNRDGRLSWKKPFKERGGLFLTFEGALRAACEVRGIDPKLEGAP